MLYLKARVRRKYVYGEVSVIVRGSREWHQYPDDDSAKVSGGSPWVEGEFSEESLQAWNNDPNFDVDPTSIDPVAPREGHDYKVPYWLDLASGTDTLNLNRFKGATAAAPAAEPEASAPEPEPEPEPEPAPTPAPEPASAPAPAAPAPAPEPEPSTTPDPTGN